MKKILSVLLLVATLAIILVPNVAGTTTVVVRQQSLTIGMNGTLIGLNNTLGIAEAPRTGMLDDVYYQVQNYPEPGEIFRVYLENQGSNMVLVKVVTGPEDKWRGTDVVLKPTESHNISYFGGYNNTTKYNISSFSFEVFYNMSDTPYMELKYDQDEDLVKIWIRNDDKLVDLRFNMRLTSPSGETEKFDLSLGPGDFFRQEMPTSSSMGTYTLSGNYTDTATGVVYDFERNVTFAQSPKVHQTSGFELILGAIAILVIAMARKYRR